MTILGVDLHEIEWTTWWILGSFVALLVGIIGWQLQVMIAGMRSITRREPDAPRYSVFQSLVLSTRAANQDFRRHALAEAKRGKIGDLFYYIFLFGLAAHIGFWIYAAKALPAAG